MTESLAVNVNARRSLANARRGAVAAWVGSALEFYDFFLYSTASALIFPGLFFPAYDPVVGVLVAFAANATAFFVRPLGGIIFGYLGDRVGRNMTLMLTLTMMGLASAAVGLIPGYKQIGLAAPVLLIICRLLQGIAQGGEHTGGVLIAFENAPSHRKGFYCAWSQSGVAAGFVISAGVFALTSRLAGPHFTEWAWRIPFLLSVLLVGLGIWIRRSVFETLHPTEIEHAKGTSLAVDLAAPSLIILRRFPKELFLGIGIRLIEQSGSYIFLVFGMYYLSTFDHIAKNTLLIIAIIGLSVDLIMMPVFGLLSDLWGRRAVYLTGAIGMTLWIFPSFYLFKSANLVYVTIAFVVGLGLFHAMLIGVQTAIIAEMFPVDCRFTGTALVHEFGSLVAGAATPIIATVLVHSIGGDWGASVYTVTLGLISIICTIFIPMRSKADAYKNGQLRNA